MSQEQPSMLPAAGWYPNPSTGEPGYWTGFEWAQLPAVEHQRQSGRSERLVTPDAAAMGLTRQQEIVEIDVPAHREAHLSHHIHEVLAQKAAHRIVAMTMATYGEFPLAYRVLITIEFLSTESAPNGGT